MSHFQPPAPVLKCWDKLHMVSFACSWVQLVKCCLSACKAAMYWQLCFGRLCIRNQGKSHVVSFVRSSNIASSCSASMHLIYVFLMLRTSQPGKTGLGGHTPSTGAGKCKQSWLPCNLRLHKGPWQPIRKQHMPQQHDLHKSYLPRAYKFYHWARLLFCSHYRCCCKMIVHLDAVCKAPFWVSKTAIIYDLYGAWLHYVGTISGQKPATNFRGPTKIAVSVTSLSCRIIICKSVKLFLSTRRCCWQWRVCLQGAAYIQARSNWFAAGLAIIQVHSQ